MPDLKVQPAGMSVHGRQYVMDASGETTLFNIAKQSRLKSRSIRSNFAVFAGEEKNDPMYQILVDLVGRTIQIVNDKDSELVAVFTKSEETLLMNAAFRNGSELWIDVARGVDWAAILSICIGLHQVGKSFAEDAFNNFLVEPVKGAAMDYAWTEGMEAYEEYQEGEGEVEAEEGGFEGGEEGGFEGEFEGGEEGEDGLGSIIGSILDAAFGGEE